MSNVGKNTNYVYIMSGFNPIDKTPNSVLTIPRLKT